MAKNAVTLQDSTLGCIIGCAVGDALGAPYEGLWGDCIPEESHLLSEFAEFEGYPRGQYTDDTQLTIATIESIIQQKDIIPHEIAKSIAKLWKTQAVIGPGGACTCAADSFLRSGDWKNCGAPKGSAGNGTAMRMAAVGLFFINNPSSLPEIAAHISQITHKDMRSVAGGIAIAYAAYLLATKKRLVAKTFCYDIADIVEVYERDFANIIRKIPQYIKRDDRETRETIAWAGMRSPEFDKPIITPFVIPTVIASLWSFLRYRNSWKQAVAHAIRLGGDVDTLGAIVGALSGIHLGIKAIPHHLVNQVQNLQYLKRISKQYFILTQKNNEKIYIENS